MSQVRVLRIIARLNIGGPAIHVSLLTREFNRRIGAADWQSQLVAGVLEEGEGDMSYIATQAGVAPLYIEGLRREIHPLHDLLALRKLVAVIREYRPHVVHTHTAKAGLLGRLAARLCGVPAIVHTYHGHVFSGYFGKAKTSVFLGLERLSARWTDRLVTLSPQLQQELVETYKIAPASKFSVVPLGLELQKFSALPRDPKTLHARVGVPAERRLVAIIGRMVPIKRHDVLFRAVAQLDMEALNCHCVVVGSGEKNDELRHLVGELGIGPSVTFLGWEDRLETIYGDVHTLVICSDNEGTPVSIIEALASGCRVVSTAVGGVGDLLEQGKLGRLVPPGEPTPLAKAIQDSLQDEDASPVSREQIASQYGIERLAGDLAQLYTSLLPD